MVFSYFKNILTRFRDETRGTIVVEAVITLPLLFWTVMATYEFFEVHRYKSIREKATYTIADMISRETTIPGFVDDNYLDNTIRLFDDMANDKGVNQVRVTIIRYNGDEDKYDVSWSETRGTGDMIELVDSDVESAGDVLPIMNHGEELIVVDSRSIYNPFFNVGLGTNIPITTRTFTSIRFLPKICYGGNSCP